MSESEMKYEMMERYSGGDMTAAEKLAFEKELSENPGFASEYQLFCETQSIITDKALIDFKQQAREFGSKYRSGQRINRTLGWSGLAATGLLITGALLFNTPDTNSISEHNNTASVSEIKTTDSSYSKTNAGHNLDEEKSEPVITKNKPVAGIFNKNNETILPDRITDSGSTPKVAVVSKPDAATNTQPAHKLTNTDNSAAGTAPRNCDELTITAQVSSKPSCYEEASGEISISRISGGKSPYLVSIDGEHFDNAFRFDRLKTGSYTITIKDADNCKKTVSTVAIAGRYCEDEFVFAPFRNEVFTIPFHSHTAGEIMIYNKSNQLIYNRSIAPGDSWNGTDNAGNQQSAGLYKFIVRYENGDLFKGFVTVIE